jgi:hypothetical protein
MWASGHFALSVDVFNFRNTEWEPLVEPWKSTIDFAALSTAKGEAATDLSSDAAASGVGCVCCEMPWYMHWSCEPALLLCLVGAPRYHIPSSPPVTC